MKLILGRLFSALFTAGGWLLAGARTVLDLIGYSTAPEDVGVAQARLDQFLGWLLSLPWWAVWGFALISTLWLIWVSWPRQRHPALQSSILSISSDARTILNNEIPSTPPTADNTKEQEAAETALMIFFLDYILPAVRAQHKLQRFMIRDSQSNNILIDYALSGIKGRSRAVEEFWRSFDCLEDAFCSSPMSHVALNNMIDHIARIEVYYGYLCGQAHDIAAKTDIDCREKYPVDWEEWSSAHSALKTAYDNEIKRSRRFGRLFRPGRESRWGDVHVPLPLGG